MNEFDRVKNRFDLLLNSAKKGDKRSLIMAGRAVARMKDIIKIEYPTKTVPRMFRRSYVFYNWMENQLKGKKQLNNT